jgi:hypothetical protein
MIINMESVPSYARDELYNGFSEQLAKCFPDKFLVRGADGKFVSKDYSLDGEVIITREDI